MNKTEDKKGMKIHCGYVGCVFIDEKPMLATGACYDFPYVSIDGPMGFGQADLISWALSGKAKDIVISYYKGLSRSLLGAVVEELKLSVVAGEVVSFSIDLVGLSGVTGEKSSLLEKQHKSPSACYKLFTWDACGVDSPDFKHNVQAFSLSIRNDVKPVYDMMESKKVNDLAVIGRGYAGSIDIYMDDLKAVLAQKPRISCKFTVGNQQLEIPIILNPYSSNALTTDVVTSTFMFENDIVSKTPRIKKV